MLRCNSVVLFVGRLCCQAFGRLLLHIAAAMQEVACSSACSVQSSSTDRLFQEYPKALLVKLVEFTEILLHPAAGRFDSGEVVDSCHVAVAAALASLSELPSGSEGLLQCRGCITILVQHVIAVIRAEVKAPPTEWCACRLRAERCAVWRLGTRVLHSLLSALLSLTHVRRGMKAAVAAAASQTIAPLLLLQFAEDGAGSSDGPLNILPLQETAD